MTVVASGPVRTTSVASVVSRTLLITAWAFVWTAPAATQAPQFSHERPITSSASGPQSLPVDLPLLRDAGRFRVVRRGDRWVAEGGLTDLRLFRADGGAVPYLLVHPPATEPDWARGRLLPIAATKITSGFEMDLGVSHRVDAIRVEGIAAPFLKRLTLEGSGDRARWTMLAAEGTLFDLPAERLRKIDLGFPPGEYRYLRVTWDDTNSGRIPLPRRAAARRTSSGEVLPETSIDVPFERGVGEPGRTRYRLRLPADRLPIVGLELEVAGGHVFRQAVVTESRFAGVEAAPAQLGGGTLSRVVRGGVGASHLRVPISPPTEAEIQLVIDDGNNPPLDVTRVSAVLAELPVVFFEGVSGTILARYGNRTLEAPTYDLEALRPTIDISKLPRASWGEARAVVEGTISTAAAPGLEPGSMLDAAGFRYDRRIPGAAAGLVALQLDAGVLAHSTGPRMRFSDVRVLDAANRQIPYLVERRDEPLVVTLGIEPATGSNAAELEPAPGQQRSIYRVSLPQDRLPSSTLVLETSARVFQRSVQIGFERPPDRRHRDAWFEVRATQVWRHADQQTPATPLSLRLEGGDRRDLLVVVDEGDNAALPIIGARALLPSYRLRFYQPPDATLRLAYGRGDLQPPRYDLALLAQQVMGAAARESTAEPERAAAGPGVEPIIPPWMFWAFLGVGVLVLVGLIAKLARA
jgi:hypothetical protein